MPQDASPAADSSPAFARLLVFGNVAALAFGLFIAGGLLVAVFALMGDAAALQAKARDSAKTVKKMRAELAELGDKLDALESPPAAPGTAQPPAFAGAAAPARALKVRADAPLRICVFRVGSGNDLASCIRGGGKTRS